MDKANFIFDELTERQLQLLRVDAEIRREILIELKKLEREILSKLIEIDNFTQKRLQSILSDVRIAIKETYQIINEKMIDNLIELSKIETTATVNNLATVSVVATDLSVEKIKKLVQGTLIAGAPSETWWKRQGEKLTRNFEDQMRQGVLLGENNSKLIQRVRGTKAFNYTNGLMNVSRNDAEALVRSSVQTASNQSRFEVMETANNVIKYYRQVSTLDSRTSDICIVRDGKRWETKTKKPVKHNLSFQVPPLHWNCRSSLIAEIEGVNLNETTRASKDGPVPANFTFEDFLKRKGDAFADEVLGKGKAELWRKGKIKLSQLLDQSGNPLTLEELKRKYN